MRLKNRIIASGATALIVVASMTGCVYSKTIDVPANSTTKCTVVTYPGVQQK